MYGFCDFPKQSDWTLMHLKVCWAFVCLQEDLFILLSNSAPGFFFKPKKCHYQDSDLDLESHSWMDADFYDDLNLYRASSWKTKKLPPILTLLVKNVKMTSLPRRKKYKETSFVLSPILSCGEVSPLLLCKMVQKETATGQDVVTLSLHYLQPTPQTTDHNKCLSYRSPVYFVF